MSITTTVTRIVYMISGSGTPSVTEIVEGRDPVRDAKKAPKGATGFHYFDSTYSTLRIRNKLMSHIGGPFNYSKTYYIDAKLFSLQELNLVEGAEDIVDNMRSGGWTQALRTKKPERHIVPFDPDRHAVVSTSD